MPGFRIIQIPRTPELLTIISFNPAPPLITYVKVSGGPFPDMMIHDFDMANFIMANGMKPRSRQDHPSWIRKSARRGMWTKRLRCSPVPADRLPSPGIRAAPSTVMINAWRFLGSNGLPQTHNVLKSTVVKSSTAGVS